MEPTQILDIVLSVRNAIFDFAISYLPLWKAISVMVSLTLTGAIAYTLFQMKRIGSLDDTVGLFAEVASARNLSRHRTVRAWKQVQKRLEIGDEAQLKLALIEADKIFDEILKLGGFKGETMADRMKHLTPAQIPNIEHLWVAHKTRNRIVHEPDFTIPRTEVDRLIREYEKAFKDFELID